MICGAVNGLADRMVNAGQVGSDRLIGMISAWNEMLPRSSYAG